MERAWVSWSNRIAAVLLLFAVGCHREEADFDAWDHLLQTSIDEDGTVSVDTARKAFVLTLGLLPGVDAPPGRQRPILDATLAVDWMLSHFDELTEAQKSAFHAALSVDGAFAMKLDDYRKSPKAVPAMTPMEVVDWGLEAEAVIVLQTGAVRPTITFRISPTDHPTQEWAAAWQTRVTPVVSTTGRVRPATSFSFRTSSPFTTIL
jgi:hypothetical protein